MTTTQSMQAKLARHVAWLQGAYYVATGLWPLVDIASFQAVTGPKTDLWLVNTIGLLLMVNGLVLLMAAYRRLDRSEIFFLGIGVALTLAGIELTYVIMGVIAPIYLLDTALQGLFILGWLQRLFRSDAAA